MSVTPTTTVFTPNRSMVTDAGKQPIAAGGVMEIVADDRAIEPRHRLLEYFGAIGRLPVAGDEKQAEPLEGFEDHLPRGRRRRTRTLEIIAAVQQQARPFTIAPLFLDGRLETRIAARHLDLLVRARKIIGMGFELSMRVGEMSSVTRLPSGLSLARALVWPRPATEPLRPIAESPTDAMRRSRVKDVIIFPLNLHRALLMTRDIAG